MCRFPESWTKQDIDDARKFVIQNNKADYDKLVDGDVIFDEYKGVNVGVQKTDGRFATTFPDNRFQYDKAGNVVENPKF